MAGLGIFLLAGEDATAQVTLEACVREALASNPGLAAAADEASAAAEEARQATASFFPSVDASGSFRRQSTVPELSIPPVELPFGMRDTYDFRVTVTQPVFTGFRLLNRRRMTAAVSEARRSETAAKRNELIARVEAAYGGVLKASRLLAVARSGAEQVRLHADDVDRFFGQGLIRRDEKLRADVKRMEAELAVLRAENALRLAVAALESAVGKALPPGAGFADPPPDTGRAETLEASLETARNLRPELAAMRQVRRAAESGRGLAAGGYWPSVAVFGTAGYGKPGLDFLRRDWMDYWLVGVGAEWNLWSWGKTRAQHRQAAFKASAAAQSERQAEEAVRLEVTQACLRIDEAAKRLGLASRMENQAAESFRVAENLYRQGQLAHADYFDAQSDLTRARTAAADAEIDMLLARSAWRRAAGLSGQTYPVTE
jgi:outer membrane protein TolC